MSQKIFRNRAIALALTLATTASTAVFAAPSIDTASLGSGVAFSTDFAYGQSFMRVVGPQGFVAEHHLGALDDLSFSFESIPADGIYNWEILSVGEISSDLRSRLEAAQAEGDLGIADRLKASGELQSYTFFGTFQVRGGVVELPTQNVSLDDRDIALKAQTFATDLIVQGSACVGFDCATTESFGSDTFRLKENNLRIHFDDTSSSASFPGNDWRLQANDSSNGGANYFSIIDATANKTPFRVDAGAPNNSLYVKSDGKVGIGTSSPAINLHVVEGNSPTLRLEQDGSDGFTPYTWDLAGNETNFFLRDVTNGSKLSFRVKPGAPENSIFVAADGNLGFGSDKPKAPVHVLAGGSVHTPTNDAVVAVFQNNANATDGSIVSILSGNGNANAQLWLGDADNDKAGRVIYRNDNDAMSFYTNGTEQYRVQSDGNICIGCTDTAGDAILHSNGAKLTAGGTWTNASSRALKQDIETLDAADAMSALSSLEPVTYRYIAEQDETYVGFIAEDVPELVSMKDRKSLTSMDVVAVLTKVVKEQQKAIEALNQRLESLDVE